MKTAIRQMWAGAALAALALVSLPASGQSPNYWPFKKGNSWTLEATFQGTKTIQIVTVTAVSGNQATLEYKVNGRVANTEVYQFGSTSVARVSSGGGTISPAIPIIQYPLTAGKKWDWKGTISAGGQLVQGTSTLSVTGPESIKTPAGQFRAMKVHSELKISAQGQTIAVPNDYWFAPNVGLVQQRAQIPTAKGPAFVDGKVTKYTLK